MKPYKLLLIFVTGCLLMSGVAAARTITWSGVQWEVRGGHGSPGPNSWNTSTNAVYIDSANRLHMNIYKQGRWYCSEVDSINRNFSYGKYTWVADSQIMNFDKNVVAGMFYYFSDSCEIDIEASQWSNKNGDRLMFSVQPVSINGDWRSFIGYNSPLKTAAPVTYSFDWEPTYVHFTATNSNGVVIADWNCTDQKYIPKVKSAIAINLWLNEGKAPSNNMPVEMIISKFTYAPSNKQ